MLAIIFLIIGSGMSGCDSHQAGVERPPQIVSLRKKVFDQSTYERLSKGWQDYYAAYPSEDAYGNWMYAARYAKDPKFTFLLHKGLEKYPHNPTLLYLSGGQALEYQEPGFGIEQMELAASLDPDYDDPWFALASAYLISGEVDKLENSLMKLLEMKAIPDEIMDYSYNMLSLLDTNAILLTNGDNDTYPGWILTRVVKYRPDVVIVNRALLETEWYCESVIEEGVPRFIDRDRFRQIRDVKLNETNRSDPVSYQTGVIGDSLCIRIIEAAEKLRRPVYLSSATRPSTPAFNEIMQRGLDLGLVILLTKPKDESGQIVRQAYSTFLNSFRTGGLDSWQLRYSPPDNDSRRFMKNYISGLYRLMNNVSVGGSFDKNRARRWIDLHVSALLSDDEREQLNRIFDNTIRQ